jgi:hypothetical protein
MAYGGQRAGEALRAGSFVMIWGLIALSSARTNFGEDQLKLSAIRQTGSAMRWHARGVAAQVAKMARAAEAVRAIHLVRTS